MLQVNITYSKKKKLFVNVNDCIFLTDLFVRTNHFKILKNYHLFESSICDFFMLIFFKFLNFKSFFYK